ncbi:hypothetical protein AtNW77_Chr1g0040941 [Arabidopsis thaliana]|uniref:Transmembrane protein n=2 Tax=Arabidopsis TaxID=3701 RepID=A0A178W005_ARATH|nr:hypothetical protein ISN45_At01g035920 [Arabidopsis thaliana x Arabidopsis arenosa]OAP11900.1 hypothetical protein AXX17_AT1G37330 [Arabidopsis thaliana]
MYKLTLCILTLSFLLLSGLSNTVLARVQYESPSQRKKILKEVWDQTLLREIKIGASGSNSGRAPSCNNSCKPNRP